MKTVLPSTPADAYGLMLAAIRDDDPVLYLAPAAVLPLRGEVPDRDVDRNRDADCAGGERADAAGHEPERVGAAGAAGQVGDGRRQRVADYARSSPARAGVR